MGRVKAKDGIDHPINMFTANYKDNGEIEVKEVPCFYQKEHIKAYLDNLRIKYIDGTDKAEKY